MAKTLWLNNGKLVTKDGKLVLCEKCPCTDCPGGCYVFYHDDYTPTFGGIEDTGWSWSNITGESGLLGGGTASADFDYYGYEGTLTVSIEGLPAVWCPGDPPPTIVCRYRIDNATPADGVTWRAYVTEDYDQMLFDYNFPTETNRTLSPSTSFWPWAGGLTIEPENYGRKPVFLFAWNYELCP